MCERNTSNLVVLKLYFVSLKILDIFYEVKNEKSNCYNNVPHNIWAPTNAITLHKHEAPYLDNKKYYKLNTMKYPTKVHITQRILLENKEIYNIEKKS